ncbi:MAG: nuclear transport factor 2 family protein [Nitrospira sp. NTP1]|mgnify:CR=1 FL=1|nr:nuclear transport factor 2 family protein [Nitrospira sp. NTP1]
MTAAMIGRNRNEDRMGERRRRWSQWSACLTGGLLVVVALLSVATADVRLLPGAAVDLDQATTNAVLKTFQQAEEALRARHVDGVMALYSEQYDYHGLKKSDMRKVWANLFDEFQDLTDSHRFSRLAKVGSGSKTIIEVTCTGSLTGLSKTGDLRVPIDSWYEEVHYMTWEDGQWRIRGNVGDSPRFMPFGTSPHPLF